MYIAIITFLFPNFLRYHIFLNIHSFVVYRIVTVLERIAIAYAASPGNGTQITETAEVVSQIFEVQYVTFKTIA